jgi:hypothetical protein
MNQNIFAFANKNRVLRLLELPAEDDYAALGSITQTRETNESLLIPSSRAP